MAKKDTATTAPTTVPVLFPIEGNVANRVTVRDLSQNYDHMRKVNLGIIKIRPGFNPRTKNRPPDMIQELWNIQHLVPELADKIYAENGPATPLIGDIHKDGHFYINDGERRYWALIHLVQTGRERYPNGKPVTDVVVVLNPAGTTDTERKKKAAAANDNLQLTPMQWAFHYLSFKEEEGWSHEQIAEEHKVSRQTVDNYIIAATKLSKDIQDKIDTGEVKMTNAVNEYRRQQAEKKPKAEKPEGDEDVIITGKLADKLEDEKKQAEKLRGDEDEFTEQDNTVKGTSSKSGPKEDRSSGEHVIGKDSIYMRQESLAKFKQLWHRYEFLMNGARQLIVADKPEDEKDEERAAILHEKRHAHVLDKLTMEYDLIVK